jgi:branched-chain amino acid transport system ATP-binding protein
VTAILRVEGLESGYGEMKVLWGVSLEVERGSIAAVLGPNGAGKTTLMKTIMGIVRPWSGRIVFNGADVTWKPPHVKVRMGMTLVPEGRRLFPDLSVEENLLLGAYIHGARFDRVRDMLELVYTLFPILKERRRQKAGTLSGGQQQMLAIARALMARPKLLLLDEPSQGIAPKLAMDIFTTLKELRDSEGLTILLVEQNVAAALKVADRVYVMDMGRIVKSGTPDSILADARLREAYLGL